MKYTSKGVKVKARYLVSCTLLSILVIFLLPTVVQATEYKKVNATDILKNISNGDDINLTGCHIIGELNVNRIKLETVPNPNFDELLKEGYPKVDLINSREENLSVIKSNIKITNSIFENDLDFSNVLFNGSADFSGAYFNGSAYFCGTIFNGSAYFSGVNFTDTADFGAHFNHFALYGDIFYNPYLYGDHFDDSAFCGAIFDGPAYFCGTHFNGPANFFKVHFNGPADFESETSFTDTADFFEADFNGPALFDRVDFNDSASFDVANFTDTADFFEAHFNDSASFCGAHFNGPANFGKNLDGPMNGEADFNGPALFDSVDFNDSASFGLVHFNDSASFCGAHFNDIANFVDAYFNGPADFGAEFNYPTFSGTNFDDPAFPGTNFNGPAYFYGANFTDPADFVGPDTSENIFTYGKTCELFREYYKTEARYTDADNIYYNSRKNAQDRKNLISLSKWIDILSWVTCGYGLRLSHTFYCGTFLIMNFTYIYGKHLGLSLFRSKNKIKSKKRPFLLYWKDPGIYRLSDAAEKKSIVSFWDALYFSVSTFTTVGSGDWYPKDNFRKWVTLEGLLGWIMLGIFMATLANILIRF